MRICKSIYLNKVMTKWLNCISHFSNQITTSQFEGYFFFFLITWVLKPWAAKIWKTMKSFIAVQLLSCVRLFETRGLHHARHACPSPSPGACSKLMSFKLVMPSNHLILHHLLLRSSIFLSTGVFARESALCIIWPKYWRFSFSISPSNEY